MQLKTVRIIVEDVEDINKRWKSAIKGRLKGRPGEEVISVANFEILGKILKSTDHPDRLTTS